MVLTYGVFRWMGRSAPRGSRALIELIQQIRRAVRTGCFDNLVQRLHPLRSLLWIRIHNPLVQCLVHGYLYYKRGAVTA